MSYKPLTSITSNNYSIAESFAGRPIQAFNKSLQHLEQWAIRIAVDPDSNPEPILYQLDDLLAHAEVSSVTHLVIGRWAEWSLGESSVELVQELAKAASKLSNLRGIFLGDITTYEAELSWINHGDITPLLDAYPDLEILQVRGMGASVDSGVRHHNLKHFCYETVDQLHAGHSSNDMVESMYNGSYPALQHLEIWQHSLFWQHILANNTFANIQYLGMRNLPELDTFITKYISLTECNSMVKALDISGGSLHDAGAEALLSNRGFMEQLEEIHVGRPRLSAEFAHEFTTHNVELVTTTEDNDEDGYDDDEIVANDAYDYQMISE